MDSYQNEPPCRMRPKPGKIIDNQDLNQAQQSLAWKVRCRSNPEDLFSKGILPDKDRFANPNFLEQKRRLSMARTSDTIRKKLDNRPSRDSLQDKNILRSGTHTSPLIQASQVSLHRKRTADLLNRQLSERPGPIDLISKGILPVPPVASSSNNSHNSRENTQSFFQKLAKAARRDSYSSNEDGCWSPETVETGSNISTESILRTHKATTPSVPSSKNAKSKKNSKQSTKQKQTNKHYNFHVYTASNYRKEPPVRNHPATLDTTESDSRISRDKKQRSSFEVCVNQQQFLLQLQVIQRYPEMKEYITPDVVKKLWGTEDAENLVTDFFTQCKITQIGLQERNLQELRNICKHNSLATTGKKAELIERILNYQKNNQVLMPEYPPEIPHKDSTDSEMKSPQVVPFKLPSFDDKNNFFKPLNPTHTSLPTYLPKPSHHSEFPIKKVPLLPDRSFIDKMPNLQLKLNEDYNAHIPQPLAYPPDSNCSLLTNGSLCTDPLDLLQPSIQPGDCSMYANETQFTDAANYLTTNSSEDLFLQQQQQQQQHQQQKFYSQNHCMDTSYYPNNQYSDNFNVFPSYNDPNPLLSPATYNSDMIVPNLTEFAPVGANNNFGYPQHVYQMDPNQNNCYSPQNYFANN